MKYLTIIAKVCLCILIFTPNLNAQYDAGTIIHSETGTNLNTVLKNYVVVDFDGDTYADVIMVKNDAATNTNQLTWYKGNGNGNFSPQNNLLSVNDAHKENEIFYEDMNGDGNKDIVFQNSDTGFTTLLNNGQGNISAQINNTVTMGNPFGADLKELADIDGDGDMDGIFWTKIGSTPNGQPFGHCLIGHNNGNGNFTNYIYLENDNPEMFLQVETGDIDGDGDLDIVCSGNIQIASGSNNFRPFVRLYKNTAPNGFATKEEIELPVLFDINLFTNPIYYANIVTKNINGNGKDELFIECATLNICGDFHNEICGSSEQFQVLGYDVPNGEFTTLQTYNSWLHGYTIDVSLFSSSELYDNAFHIQFGNQNNDNNLDILSINVPQGKLHWYLGDGNGGFNNTQVVNFNSQYSNIKPALRVADIDNDTDLDIFVLLNDNTSSNLTVFKNLALSPACASVLDLAATPLTNGIYQAGTTLISSGDVSNGNNVTLKAGNRVRLESGFRIPQNSLVKVKIDPCN